MARLMGAEPGLDMEVAWIGRQSTRPWPVTCSLCVSSFCTGGAALSPPGIVTTDLFMSPRRGQQELLHLGGWEGQGGNGAAVVEVREMLPGRAEKFSILLQGQSLQPMALLAYSMPSYPEVLLAKTSSGTSPYNECCIPRDGACILMEFYCPVQPDGYGVGLW